ncbi:MAG: DUF2505 domain-containing protein [Propionibacteriaceae bacterium]|nr:DUF2505 domain-containing protein [Propionibacteriaceae bacterium]
MRVHRTLQFAAPPVLVSDMMIAADFQEGIAAAISAPECSVVAENNKVTSVFLMPTFGPLHQVSGSQQRLVGEFEWTTPLQDDCRQGRVSIRIERFPVIYDGTVNLSFDGRLTSVVYDTNLNIDVPQLETSVARATAQRTGEILGYNQAIGEAWLRNRGIEHPEP